MKKPNIFQASNSLFGAILILSLFSTIMINGFEACVELYAVCKSQWHLFTESLSLIQPHRTIFPH